MRRFSLSAASALAIAFLLAGCSSASNPGDAAGQLSAASKGQVTPDLEPTIRQAAVDAEANYKYGEAANHYTTLLERHPDDQDLVLSVARNLRYSGAPQQAAQVINARIAKAGVQPVLLIELGKDYLAADQLNLAVPALEQAKSLDGGNWDIYSALGAALDHQGKFADAQKNYEAGLKLAPNNPELLNNYALSLAQSGQLDAAITTLRQAIDLPTATAQTRQNLAFCLALKGDADGAARLVRVDLPEDMARSNIAYYRSMTAQ